ncbi:MAG: SHOCT domain-containing protein [Verrucomicrobiota bacterium]
MKRNETQCGHTLVEHVIQFALMAGIIVAIIYACGGQGEETMPVKTKATSQASVARRPAPAYAQPGEVARTLPTTPNTAVPGGYQPIGDPRFIQRRDPRMTQKTATQESTIPQQASGETISQEPIATETATSFVEHRPSSATSAGSPVARSESRADMRVVRVRQEDPERMGRVIIIVAVIALAVIVFWFIHSNMMYKRTLRAVAATHPKPEDNPLPGSAPAVSTSTHTTAETHAIPSATTTGEHAEKNSIVGRLAQLKEMFDQGLISQEDYDAKKKDILAHL